MINQSEKSRDRIRDDPMTLGIIKNKYDWIIPRSNQPNFDIFDQREKRK